VALGERHRLRGLSRVDGVGGFLGQADEIRQRLAGPVVVPHHPLAPRVGHLGRVGRELDPRFPGAAVLTNGDQLVHAAQGGMVGRGDEMRAHTPGVDGRALSLEVGDQVLVQLVGRHDQRVLEAGVGEHAMGGFAKPGQVARIETHGRPHGPSGRT